MVYYQAPAFPGDSARRAMSYDEVLEGLFEYFATPDTVIQVLRLIRFIRARIAAGYIANLGKAYARVYRAPSYPNCAKLTEIEEQASFVFDSFMYFDVLKTRLEENFKGLAEHPVFQNPGLRLRLDVLRSRALTLFYAPQLIRDRSLGDTRALDTSIRALVESEWYDPRAALHFISVAYRVNGRRHAPRLLANHLAVLYRRLENCKAHELDHRPTSRVLAQTMKELDSVTRRTRRKMAQTLRTDHGHDALFDAAFALWTKMVAGGQRYSLQTLGRVLR
ncbi:MAG: hypothetical protein AAGC60_08925 [Acidobacteriota bacterium]